MADLNFAVEHRVTDADEEVEQHLLAALRQNDPPSDGKPLSVFVRDAKGELVGGLVGSTAYGWLLIKILWVDAERRGAGLGAELVERAEDEARRQGCHGAWLDTSSERAARFYRRLGYDRFGLLDNRAGEHPRGHSRDFLSKRFST